jgi:hypothetical protein
MKKLIPEGGLIPRGWAVSHRCMNRDAAFAYPYGIHLIVRWLRDLRFWLMWVGYPGFQDETEHRLYVLGLQHNDEAAMRTIDHYSRISEKAVALADSSYQAGWSAAFKHMDEQLVQYVESRRAEPAGK